MVSHNLSNSNRHTSCRIIPGRPIVERRFLMPLGSQHGTNVFNDISFFFHIVRRLPRVILTQIIFNKLRFAEKRGGTAVAASINISQIIFVFLLAVKVLGYPPRIGFKRILTQILFRGDILVINCDNRFQTIVRSENRTAFSLTEFDDISKCVTLYIGTAGRPPAGIGPKNRRNTLHHSLLTRSTGSGTVDNRQRTGKILQSPSFGNGVRLPNGIATSVCNRIHFTGNETECDTAAQ